MSSIVGNYQKRKPEQDVTSSPLNLVLHCIGALWVVSSVAGMVFLCEIPVSVLRAIIIINHLKFMYFPVFLFSVFKICTGDTYPILFDYVHKVAQIWCHQRMDAVREYSWQLPLFSLFAPSLKNVGKNSSCVSAVSLWIYDKPRSRN